MYSTWTLSTQLVPKLHFSSICQIMPKELLRAKTLTLTVLKDQLVSREPATAKRAGRYRKNWYQALIRQSSSDGSESSLGA